MEIIERRPGIIDELSAQTDRLPYVLTDICMLLFDSFSSINYSRIHNKEL
ncbi:MAG: hypothetical protein ACP5US_09755 [Candidatus Kryptoniota bacterium]